MPERLEWLTRSCLARNPDDRWQSAPDLRMEIGWLLDGLRRPVSVRAPRSFGGTWWLVSEHGGILPRWSRDGCEIFYLTQDHITLFAAAVAGEEPSFRVLGVQRLFSAPLVVGRGYPYDVSPDGQRFVVVTSRGAAPTVITLMVDWPSEVRR